VLYSIYGLYLEADLALPGLLPCDLVRGADVRIRLEPTGDREGSPARSERVWYRSLPQDAQEDASGDSALTIFRSTGDEAFRFRYPDGVEFLIDDAGSEVRARWPPTSTLEDVTLYLTGPLLGFLLRLRGIVSLHASVVAIGGRAIAFVGPAGAGKSTTAAAFAVQGYPVLTEDVAALFERDGAFEIRSGYPHVALWPDSTAMLFGSAEALPTFTPGWDKRCLDLTPPGRFAAWPLPLCAVYVLSGRGVRGAPGVAPMSPGRAMLALLGNIYGNLLFHRELRVQELDTVRRLASTIPVSAAFSGGDSSALSAFCDAVLDDCRADPDARRDVQHC
jgi:hypothetical protein